MPTRYYTINSGFVVGSPVDMRQFTGLKSIYLPALTSGDLFIQGALPTAAGVAPASGAYARMMETREPGSGQMRFATGPGSAWLGWPIGYNTLPPFIRPELAVTQADTRTLVLITR